MSTAEEAIKDSLDSGGKPITAKDEDGNEFHQRPIDISAKPKQPRKRAGKRVKVISVYPARQFLSDGTIDHLEKKSILVSDYELLGERVQKIA